MKKHIVGYLLVSILCFLFLGRAFCAIINPIDVYTVNSQTLQMYAEEANATLMVYKTKSGDEAFKINCAELAFNRYLSVSVDALNADGIKLDIADNSGSVLESFDLKKGGTYTLQIPNGTNSLSFVFSHNSVEDLVIDLEGITLHNSTKTHNIYKFLIFSALFAIVCFIAYKSGFVKNKFAHYAVFGVFAVYVVSVCMCMKIEFDDWKYLSLSYQYIPEGSIGHEFTFAELIDFLKGHYVVWGGRVLYFGLFIALYAIHPVLYKLLMAFAIILISYLTYKTVSGAKPVNKFILAITSCLLFGLFNRYFVTSGIYWMTAGACYVLPTAVLVLLIYLTLHEDKFKHKKTVYVSEIVLAFLAGFSQEQIAVALVIFVAGSFMFETIQKKNFSLRKFLVAVSGTIGAGIMLLAPGNYARMGAEESLSFLPRVYEATANMIIGIYSQKTLAIVAVLMLTSLYCAIYLAKNKDKRLYGVGAGICVLGIVLYAMHITDNLQNRFSSYERFVFVYMILFLIITVTMLAMIGLYLKERKDNQATVFLLIAVSAVLPCFYSDYFTERMLVPIMFLMYVPLASVILDIFADKKVKAGYAKIFIATVALMAIITLGVTLYAYYNNYQVFKENYKTLEEASAQGIKTVHIKKAPYPLYETEVPAAYQNVVTNGMKHYFEFDADTEIVYE